MRKLIATLLLCTFPVLGAAINATVQWDVRTTGSDSNSGGFDPSVGSPGTDESQQNSGTSMTLVVAVTTTQATSTPAFSATTHGPGNTVLITGGAGCTTGLYEELSQSGGTGTFNASFGTAAAVCTGIMGGSKATFCSNYSGGNCTSGGMAFPVGGNTIWMKSGTYTTTVTQATTNAAGNDVNFTLEGYATAHGDFGTPPVLTTATNSVNVISNFSTGLVIANVNFSITASSPFSCIGDSTSSSATLVLYKVKCDMTGTTGGAGLFQQSTGVGGIWGVIVNSEFACNSTGEGIEDLGGNGNGMVVQYSYFHGCLSGIWDGNTAASQRWSIRYSAFGSNTRAVYQQAGGFSIDLQGNSFQSMSAECVRGNGTNDISAVNNVFYSCTYGVFANSAPTIQFTQNNAFGAIGTANYFNLNAGINSSDIALSANPFTSATNFLPNTTAGGGPLIKAAGFPGTASFGTGAAAVGALQPTSTGGAAPHALVQ
jgi:hypothetical protein